MEYKHTQQQRKTYKRKKRKKKCPIDHFIMICNFCKGTKGLNLSETSKMKKYCTGSEIFLCVVQVFL